MAFVLRRLLPLVLLALFCAPAAYAWTWPVQGPVLQQFSFDPAHPYGAGQHRGIDVGSPTASPVLAPAAGTVTFAGTVPTSGRCVTIETEDGYSVTLTHLGTIAVARGAAVVEGDTVGTVGPSGTPDFDVPYVHLGIRVASDPNGYLDPLTMLPPLAPQAAPETSSATADSSASPAATTPAGSAAQPAVPAPAVSVAGVAALPPAASAIPAAPAVPAPVVPVMHATTATRADIAKPSISPVQQTRPAPVKPHVRARPPAAIDAAGGHAHAGWQPQPGVEAPIRLRHRPVPAPASPRERTTLEERPFPALPLALGAGAVALAIAALAGTLRLRRRPGSPPETGAVVIPLPPRFGNQEERRVA